MRKLFSLLSILLTVSVISFGQSVVNTTGATVSSGAYVFEYSIGEIAITTLTPGNATDNYAVTQGVLQPEYKVLAKVCDVISAPLITYPNPATSKFRFLGQYDWITNYSVYAADGKLVRLAAPVVNGSIDISTLPDAAYFIKLIPGCGDHFKILKVIKQ
jgi:hypothetical protein